MSRDDLRAVPVTFEQAARFVDSHHRHHSRPQGHKFSIGVAIGNELVGAIIVGRPVARAIDDGMTLEVTRSVTDGTRNANSFLYRRAWEAAKAMGFRRLITYTQEGESGASLNACGYIVVAQRPPRAGWDTPSRRRELRGNEGIPRTLWEISLDQEKDEQKDESNE